jgi:Protein of unknown function (DUF1479)
MVCLVAILSLFNTDMKRAGGAIERWEDLQFRNCFSTILSGNWRLHDPYELESRLNARSSLYGRPSQVGMFLYEENVR